MTVSPRLADRGLSLALKWNFACVIRIDYIDLNLFIHFKFDLVVAIKQCPATLWALGQWVDQLRDTLAWPTTALK
jgi:hypothetical protein